jgi:hypothetical protein
MVSRKDKKTELDVYMHIRNYSISTFCCVTTIKGNNSINVAVYCNEPYSSNIYKILVTI